MPLIQTGFQTGFSGGSAGSSGGGGGGTLLRTITVEETSGSASLPVGAYINGFFGFADTEIPSGYKLEARKSDGTTVLGKFQYDLLRTNDNSSQRTAAWKFKLEDAISSAGTADFKFYAVAGSRSTSSAHTFSTITGLFNWNVQAVVGGTTYTATMSSGTPVEIAKGPVCTEYEVKVKLENGGTPHSAMWAWFYVRLYEDGTTCRVGAKLINGYVDNGSAITVTSSALKDGSTTVASFGSKTLYPKGFIWLGVNNQPDIHYWTANRPAFYVKYSMADIQTGHLLWKMKSSAGILSAIGSASPGTYDPNDDSFLDQGGGSQNGTGSHPWLGQCHSNDAKALVKQDKNWHKQAVIEHMTSFLTSSHFYESTGFYPPVMNNRHGSYSMGPDRKSVGSDTAATLTITGQAGTPAYDATHYPAWGMYPYITTGDKVWLDEMKAHSVSLVMSADPGTSGSWSVNYVRNVTLNGTAFYGLRHSWSYAGRDMAHYHRMLSNASYLTHDDAVDLQYMKDMLSITFWPGYTAYITEINAHDANAATLGWPGMTDVYGTSLSAPWMMDYGGPNWAMAIRRGEITSSHLFITHFVVKNQIGRSANGCIKNAVPYRMTTESGNTNEGSNPTATAWSQVYVGGDAPGDRSLLIPGGGCPSGVDTGSDGYVGGHAYGNIYYAAIAAYANVGLSGASTIKAYYDANNGSLVAAQEATFLQYCLDP